MKYLAVFFYLCFSSFSLFADERPQKFFRDYNFFDRKSYDVKLKKKIDFNKRKFEDEFNKRKNELEKEYIDKGKDLDLREQEILSVLQKKSLQTES